MCPPPAKATPVAWGNGAPVTYLLDQTVFPEKSLAPQKLSNSLYSPDWYVGIHMELKTAQRLSERARDTI